MANPLPNEKELYERIKSENIALNPDIWDLLYHRIGDDITSINLLCQYYLGLRQPVPVEEAKKILNYTRHIKDIVNEVTRVSKSDFAFPEFLDDIPLHPVLREMFTHYIGNDVYMMNLIVGDAVDPLGPQGLSLETIQRILNHTRSIRNFINRLQAATSQQKMPQEAPETAGAKSHDENKKELTKEEVFLKIRCLFAKEFKISKEDKITPLSRFREDLNLDSVDAIRVIMVLEEGFGLEIADADAEGIFTVGQAADYIYRRLKEGH